MRLIVDQVITGSSPVVSVMNSQQRIGVRRKGIHWDYNWDGEFYAERMTPDDKRYWRRWKRRIDKKDTVERRED